MSAKYFKPGDKLPKFAHHLRYSAKIEGGKIVGSWSDSGEVRVMASAENYAMVRHKGCMPFVVEIKKLFVL